MTENKVTLAVADRGDITDFKKELQASFAVAVVEEMGSMPDEPIPSDEVLDNAIDAPSSVVLRILCDGQIVGGAVLTIDTETHHNSLDLFFLRVGQQGRGIGLKAWFAIEQRYPDTISWQTHTPYFEKRNIHFYVNKCGFKIIEFFNKHHSDPNNPDQDDFGSGDGDAFQFEKIMRGV
ncbi:GNAT family N-acetyltransferase [Roseomonas sp. USHLN139]|uniref:GNAT family N-acetyltransferase n=1 Tax=Roseomonas sp. USHLN139 TaxID=3081298 RepID=UPI003B02E84E